MTAVNDQKGTVGKLIYDPSAYNNINGVAEKGNALSHRYPRRQRHPRQARHRRHSLLQPARCLRKRSRRHRKAQFQSRLGRQVLQRPGLVRQLNRTLRRYAPADRRFPPRSEKIPAHQARYFLSPPRRAGPSVFRCRGGSQTRPPPCGPFLRLLFCAHCGSRLPAPACPDAGREARHKLAVESQEVVPI